MQTVPAPGPPTLQLKARSESSSGTPTVTSLLRSPNGSDPPSTPLRNIGLSSKDSSSPAVAESNASGFLDSELVVDQGNGRAKVGKEHIRPLHTEACSLLQEFPNIRALDL